MCPIVVEASTSRNVAARNGAADVRFVLQRLLLNVRARTAISVHELQDLPQQPHLSAAVDESNAESTDVDVLTSQLSIASAAGNAIERALARLDSGEYGRCEDCSQSISLARLSALPFATRCLACQQAFESGKAAEAV